MRSKLIRLLAIASLTAFTGAAAAQMAPTPNSGPSSKPSTTPSTESPASQNPSSTSGSTATDPEFAKVDKDHDGKISKKEAASNKDLAKRFNELDTDHDGSLQPAEFARFEAEPSAGGKQ